MTRTASLRVLALCLVAAVLSSVRPHAVSPDIVISQVYGGGGNSGATYKNDFVELYNRGTAPVDVTGWTVQYASSTGSSWNRTTLSGTIAAGSYYLVQQAAGAGGTVDLPPPDAVGNAAMSSSAGKVALVGNSDVLSGTCPSAAIVDFVGYGSGTNCFEGTGPTASLSNTTAALRQGNGAVDTDSNSADFATGAPNPRSSSPPPMPADVVISQIYGGGGNSGAQYTHDFIELHNRETVDVSVAGWSVQYASSGGTSWSVTALSGTIPAGGYYLIQQAQGSGGAAPLPPPDAIGAIAMSSSAGKVALVVGTANLSGSCPIGSAIDFVGYGSAANCFEGTAPTGTLSNTTAALRAGQGAIDTNDNAADFIVGAPLPHKTPPSGLAQSTPASAPSGSSVLLTVTTTQGSFPAAPVTSVTGDLTAFGGGTAEPLFDDGTHGDAAAGDAVFSIGVVLTGGPGFRGATFSIGDEIGRTGTATLQLAVEAPLTPISAIQGAGATSLLAGVFTTTSGIVTARRDNGFFIQTPDVEQDADPQTSEGLFVFTGGSPALPSVGDAVRVSGLVAEFPAGAEAGSLTEISGGPVFHVAAAGVALPAPAQLLPSFTAPTGDRAQLERFEGMRVGADLVVVAPSRGFKNEAAATGSSTGEFYAVIEGVARPMREPGLDPDDPEPAGLPCCVPRFDGNPERLRVLSDMQPGAARLDVTTGQRIPGVTGVLDFTFGLYAVLPDPGAATVDGPRAAIPVPAPNANEFTVASFNLERFFDEINDAGVDDVAVTAEGVERRLTKASLTVRDVLQLPDILGVVEVENLGILERLASRVNADAVAAGGADPVYTAYLQEGNDVGGIDVGFLVKRSRVDAVAVTQEGKDATFVFDGSVSLLNDRPPLVLEAIVHGPSGEAVPVTVIVNHLRSLIDIVDPLDGARVRAKRAAQAEFLAALVQARQASQQVIVIGDFNAFQFNDGLVDVTGTIAGRPAPADQVAQPTLDLVAPDLTNLGELLETRERYSFVFDGNAQAIDHVLVNDRARSHVSRMRYSRSNADFPESLRGDAARPERLSDHDAAVAYFGFAPMAIEDLAVMPATLGPPNHRMVDVTVSYAVSSPSGAASCALEVASSEPADGLGDGDTPVDWEIVDANHVRLRAERSGTGTGRVYTVVVTCTDAVGNTRAQSVAVTVPK